MLLLPLQVLQGLIHLLGAASLPTDLRDEVGQACCLRGRVLKSTHLHQLGFVEDVLVLVLRMDIRVILLFHLQTRL